VKEMKETKKYSAPFIKRMPIYYRYLSTLLQVGVNRISSNDLSRWLGITASQVRQDFSSFEGSGLQGYGYEVSVLHKEIANVLGLDVMRKMIVLGGGSLGQALAKHTNFERNGFKIVAIFDINPQVVGKKIRDIEVLHVDTLQEFISSNQVDLTAITVPASHANEAANLVVEMGITAIWNFVPVELKVPKSVVVENIHLSDSLMVLGYKHKENKMKIEQYPASDKKST
jgi:redox-sensing transcriptional repressor